MANKWKLVSTNSIDFDGLHNRTYEEKQNYKRETVKRNIKAEKIIRNTETLFGNIKDGKALAKAWKDHNKAVYEAAVSEQNHLIDCYKQKRLKNKDSIDEAKRLIEKNKNNATN